MTCQGTHNEILGLRGSFCAQHSLVNVVGNECHKMSETQQLAHGLEVCAQNALNSTELSLL